MENQKLSLNAGELSDELAGRIDLGKVQMGLRRAENVRVMRVGGVTRRAGFEFAGMSIDQEAPTRLQGFRFSDEQGYVLEFGHEVMRVLRDGQYVLDESDDPVEYETPWLASQVFELQFAQRITQIVVVHPDVEPHLINFNQATGGWSVVPFPWQERVWEPATAESVRITLFGLTGSGYATTDVPVFFGGLSVWENVRLQVSHVRPEQIVRRNLVEAVGSTTLLNISGGVYPAGTIVHLASTSYDREFGDYMDLEPAGNRVFFTLKIDWNGPAMHVTGFDSPDLYPGAFQRGALIVEPKDVRSAWSFETVGTWTGTYVVERSYDDGATWQSLRVLSSLDDKNYLAQDTEELDAKAQVRVMLFDVNSGQISTNRKFAFTSSPYRSSGVGRITGWVSDSHVEYAVEKPFEREVSPTTDWQEDAFNPKNGYPKTCTFHQKRLFFGGSKARPQSIWSSRIRRPYDFTQGTFAEDGLAFETEATEYESVLWLASHLSLLVGTTSGIWAITSPDGQSITPENNAIARQVRHGGFLGIPPVALESNILYLQTKGRKIRELTGGSVEYGGYVDVDLTQLASHVTSGGVTQITKGDIPDTTLYVVSGGELAVLTYERAQNVVGWTRFITDGLIESVATCPGAGEDDEIYIVVKRGDTRTVERMKPDMLALEEAGDIRQMVFLDSSVTKTEETSFTSVGGLGHLEGRVVEIFGDGESLGNLTVDTGMVTLPRAVLRATVGLPYTSLIETMPLDQGAIGSKSGISSIVVRLRNSLGVEASQNSTQWTRLIVGQHLATGGAPPVLETGDVDSVTQASWGRQPTFLVRQTHPLPMTILALRLRGKTSR